MMNRVTKTTWFESEKGILGWKAACDHRDRKTDGRSGGGINPKYVHRAIRKHTSLSQIKIEVYAERGTEPSGYIYQTTSADKAQGQLQKKKKWQKDCIHQRIREFSLWLGFLAISEATLQSLTNMTTQM